MKIFCLGEILMRLSPALNGEWIRQKKMDFHLGGAELNVANALACWKQPVAYCTAMPGNYLAVEIRQYLESLGIDLSPTVSTGERIGIYYLPQGADLKHAGVVYDRAGSSFASLRPGMLDWEKLLDGIGWFHFSAITPALHDQLAGICEEALAVAAAKKIRISVDLNFRAKLWQNGRDPVRVMHPLVKKAQLVMGNIWSINSLLGLGPGGQEGMAKDKAGFLQLASHAAAAVFDAFPACDTLANTFRFDRDGGIDYYASLDTRTGRFVSAEYRVGEVIDRVGSGDCFMAGLVYAQANHFTSRGTIDFATAAAVGKFSEKGDFTGQDIEKVKHHMISSGSKPGA